MFEVVEEGVYWCILISLWEEEVLGEFSVWFQKVSYLESTHRSDIREEPYEGGTRCAQNPCDT